MLITAGEIPLGCGHTPGVGYAASRDSLGLVILDCEIRHRDLIPISIKIDPGSAYLKDLEMNRADLKGKWKNGVLVFEHVPPSRYRVTQVRTPQRSEEGAIVADIYDLPFDDNLLVTVPPGGATYLGRLVIRGARPVVLYRNDPALETGPEAIQLGYDYKVERSEERERKVWARVLRRKWSRPWGARIRRHLD
jgi:hypothetical protein